MMLHPLARSPLRAPQVPPFFTIVSYSHYTRSYTSSNVLSYSHLTCG